MWRWTLALEVPSVRAISGTPNERYGEVKIVLSAPRDVLVARISDLYRICDLGFIFGTPMRECPSIYLNNPR